MSANKPQQTAWHTSAAVSSAPLIEQSEGDGLNSMRSLRAKYNEKVVWLAALGKNTDFYVRAVVALDALIEGPHDNQS
jgi:hypothetical protein